MTTGAKSSGSRKSILFLVFAFELLSPFFALSQQQRKPLSESEIYHLLRNHVPAESIVDMASQFRIAFEIGPDIASQLRETGASEQLLSKLREYQPKPTAPNTNSLTVSAVAAPNSPVLIISSATGDAEVYVDDVRQGRTSVDGLLKIINLPPGRRKVRISRAGHPDFEDAVELKLGETTMEAIPTLQVATAAASPPSEIPTSKPAAETTATPTITDSYSAVNKPAGSSTRQAVAVHDAFHIVGIPALRRNKKFDLAITTSEMTFSEGGRQVYRIPFERITRVQMNPTKRDYAKTTYAAVVALGPAGALVLANQRNVDALIIYYRNEKGGAMEMVIQVPQGKGTSCLDKLAHGGIAIGPAEDRGS